MELPEEADASARTGGPIPDNKLQIVNPDEVPHGTIERDPSHRREDIDTLLKGIKVVVGIMDGSQQEHRNFAKNFLDSKTPEILRYTGNLSPTKEQIINTTIRLFQLAKQDPFHIKNCTSLKYVYNKAGAIIMTASVTKPKIAVIS